MRKIVFQFLLFRVSFSFVDSVGFPIDSSHFLSPEIGAVEYKIKGNASHKIRSLV